MEIGGVNLNKCLCDICERNDADKSFKVKKKYRDYSGIGKPKWSDIDICEECYEKLKRVKADKAIEDMITDLVAESHWNTDYEDTSEQSAYMTGFQDILDMLYHNRIISSQISVK